MGRKLPRKLSPLGWRIYDRMRALNLNANEIAAAAGISSSTLYRLMRADRRGTADPRLSTKRRLAQALRMPMATLFDDEQLELVYELGIPLPSNSIPLEALVLHHVRLVPEEARVHATRAAAVSLVDLLLTVSGFDPRINDLGLSTFTTVPSERLLLMLLQSLPEKLQRSGAQAAISAMLKVQRLTGIEPSKKVYASITRTRWSDKRLARDRPPLATVGSED